MPDWMTSRSWLHAWKTLVTSGSSKILARGARSPMRMGSMAAIFSPALTWTKHSLG